MVDLYIAAFSWREEAEDDTPLGSPSQIAGFKSNRRQDCQHALWELDQKFPSVLSIDLALVTKMIIEVVSEHSIHEHRATGAIEAFDIDGLHSGLLTDYSGIWVDSYGSFGQEPISMLHTYFRHLDEKILADGTPLPREIFELLITTGRVGVLWRKLLELSLKHDALRHQLRSAAWAKPLLLGYDTQRLLFLFVKAVYPDLSSVEKTLVENAIMDLPIHVRGGVFFRETRDHFLGSLEGNVLETKRAKSQQTRLRKANRLRLDPGEESRITGGAMATPPPEILYGWRGIDMSNVQNRKLAELQKPLKDFNSTYMNVNSAPTLEDALDLLPEMEAMWCGLDGNGASLPNDDVVHESFALLIQAASKIALTPELMTQQDLVTFVERILVTGRSTLRPEMDESQNDTFDKQASWGSPSGRVEAAEGLMFLITTQQQYRLLHHAAFLALLSDASALVRSRVSNYVLRLYHDRPEEMWRLIERFATDRSTQVRRSIVLALDQLAQAHPERSLRLVAEILNQTDPLQAGGDELRRLAIQTLTGYYIWRGDQTAYVSILKLVAGLPEKHREVANMTFTLRHGMMAKPVEGRSDAEAEETRQRSVEIFGAAIENSSAVLFPSLKKLIAKEALTDEEAKVFREMTKLTANLSQELYFAVGAFQEGRPYGPPTIETPEQVWLYRAIGSRWDTLADIGEAKVAHSLTQSLEMFIPIDPETIFLRVGAILRGSKAWGYQYEQLGFDLVLRIFTTYLAEYPELFQKNPECLRIMRETLELFIGVGWVAARSLSYRLDELFR